MTIRRQMVLLIALPTLAIYMLAAALTVAYMHSEARRTIERDMTRLASDCASRFDGHLREVARIAETSARAMESARGITDDEVYALLAKNVGQTELVYGSCMAFEPGARKAEGVLFAPYVCRDPGGLRRMNIDQSVYDWYRDPQFTWYAQPKSLGHGVWSDPYFDEGAGNILMSTYSAPFRAGGAFGGVNTVDIDLPRLRDTVGRAFDADLDFVILAADGKFVFHPDPSRIMSKTIFDLAKERGNAPLAELGRTMLAGGQGVGLIDQWDGLRQQIVSYAPIGSAKWVFACRAPESKVMADVRRRTAWGAGGLALTLGLIVASIFVVSKRIAGPIAELRNQVREVASGNLEVRIEETGRAEEIGDLARGINQMTSNLRAHIDRLATESIRLNSTATEISAATRQQEASASTFGAASSQIAAAVKEISATGKDLVRTMESVSENAAETADARRRRAYGPAGDGGGDARPRSGHALDRGEARRDQRAVAEDHDRHHHDHQGRRPDQHPVDQRGHRGGEGGRVRRGLPGHRPRDPAPGGPNRLGHAGHRADGAADAGSGVFGRDGDGPFLRSGAARRARRRVGRVAAHRDHRPREPQHRAASSR